MDVPDGGAVGIYDFGVVHHTRNAVRVLDILGGIQVVHRALDAGSTVQGGVGTFHGLVQIRLGQHDLTDCAVVGKLARNRCAGVRILIVRQPGAVSGIGAGCILRCVIQRNGYGVAFRRAQQGSAAVGRADVSVVVTVGQINDRSIIILEMVSA